MFLSYGKSTMKHLHHHGSSSLLACRRLFLTSRTIHQKSSTESSCPKVIYGVAPSLGDNMVGNKEYNARVAYILSLLEKAKLTPKFRGSEIIQLENSRAATMEEITSVHSRSYVSCLEMIAEEAKASEEGVLVLGGTGPSHVTAKTFEESLFAAGTGLSVIDSVVEASKANVYSPTGFALIRPPDNHDVPNRELPVGYCVFNNVAIAARYAQRVHGLKRVFIINFDAHNGNGSNDAFHDDPDVFFFSTHQDGCYPLGTPKSDDIGCVNGEETTLNLELPEPTGDVAMRNVFNEVIEPAAKKFKPDMILVSAGYDGHILDRSGKFQMTSGGYYTLSLSIKVLAKDVCRGRCVFLLEGGYYLTTHGDAVVESFRAFVGDSSMAPCFPSGTI